MNPKQMKTTYHYNKQQQQKTHTITMSKNGSFYYDTVLMHNDFSNQQ